MDTEEYISYNQYKCTDRNEALNNENEFQSSK
jgi:hypothetical protein